MIKSQSKKVWNFCLRKACVIHSALLCLHSHSGTRPETNWKKRVKRRKKRENFLDDFWKEKTKSDLCTRFRNNGSDNLSKRERQVLWSDVRRKRITWGEVFYRYALLVERLKIETLQWRVWSWLRMNASGRPNTCKSSGSRSSNTLMRAAHGCVTRMQPTLYWGIARRNLD